MVVGNNVGEVKEHVLASLERQGGSKDDRSLYYCPEYEKVEPVEKDDLHRGFDAESIVSTYSNTENHPGKIVEPKQRRKGRKGGDDPLAPRAGDIRLSAKGLPMCVVHEAAAGEESEDEQYGDGDCVYDEGDEEPENLGKKRPKKETAEEKRARKAAVKAARAEARQRKKQLKTAFKKEEHGQSQRLSSAHGAMQGRTVLPM